MEEICKNCKHWLIEEYADSDTGVCDEIWRSLGIETVDGEPTKTLSKLELYAIVDYDFCCKFFKIK